MLNKDIIELKKHDISDIDNTLFGVVINNQSFDEQEVIESIKKLTTAGFVDSEEKVRKAFKKFLETRYPKNTFYEFVEDYSIDLDNTMKYARLEKVTYREWLNRIYDDNYNHYISQYMRLCSLAGESLYEKTPIDMMNEFLKEIGLVVGTVGEKNYRYFISTDKNNQELVQNIYFGENFYDVALIDRETMKLTKSYGLVYISSSSREAELKDNIKKNLGVDDFYLVDNYGAEQFDDIEKVKKITFENHYYVKA